MAKVRKLRLVKNECNVAKEHIAYISEIIKGVRRGDIQGVVVVAKHRNGDMESVISANYCEAEMVGGLALAKSRLIDKWRE